MPQSLSCSLIAAALSLAAVAPASVLAEDSESPPEAAETRKYSGRGSAGGSSESPWMGEAVNVTAKGTAADVPSALATNVVEWQDEAGAPSDFQDLVTRLPGIGATGQNGIFETFSIRGSGGNGILVLVGGMPVTAQRRAGVPVSLLSPRCSAPSA